MKIRSNTIETLRAAKQVLVDMGWCQGHAAVDEYNQWVSNQSPLACAYCITGAIGVVQGMKSLLPYDLLDQQAQALGYSDAVEFNDTSGRTKEEVLQLFDKAIEHASNN